MNSPEVPLSFPGSGFEVAELLALFLHRFVHIWVWKLLLRQAQECRWQWLCWSCSEGRDWALGALEAAPPWDTSDCDWKGVSDEATEIRTSSRASHCTCSVVFSPEI